MTKSISDAVRQLLKEEHYLSLAVEKDLVNYSALARMLRAEVSRQVGHDVTQEAVFTALRREVEKSRKSGSQPAGFLTFVRSNKVFLKDHVTLIHLKRFSGLSRRLVNLMEWLDGFSGKKILILPDEEHFSIVVEETHAKEVLACATEPKSLLRSRENCAVLTVTFDAATFETSVGGLHFYTALLATSGISILLAYSSYDSASFVINQADAPVAFQKMSAAVKKFID